MPEMSLTEFVWKKTADLGIVIGAGVLVLPDSLATGIWKKWTEGQQQTFENKHCYTKRKRSLPEKSLVEFGE